jgi:hypothetical protein
VKLKSLEDFIFEKEVDLFLESILVLSENKIEWDPKTGETKVYDRSNNTVTWTFDGATSTQEKRVASALIDFLNKIRGDKKKVLTFLKKSINAVSGLVSSPKRLITFLISAVLLSGALTAIDLKNDEDLSDHFVEIQDAITIAGEKESELRSTKVEKTTGNLDKFLKEVAFSESSGDWKKINSLGYIGLYQFGKIALKEVGLDRKIDTERFRKNPGIFPPELQHEKMKELMSKNWHYMRSQHGRVGDTVDGIPITKSGMIAAAHLVGAKSVRKYLKSEGKINPADANGVRVSDYMNKFKGYDLSGI